MIPYSTQCIEHDDITAVTEALQREYLTGGSTVEEFEKSFSRYIGSQYAVALSSGTAALHAACSVIGIHENDEVITTPNTWVSSANAALYCGGRPVFSDIDKQTYNINPKNIEEKITSHTRAIIPVHYAGQPCDMEEIHTIAKKYNLYVVEDAAHAIGATDKCVKVGNIPGTDMTIFSFHPVKQMTTCEGGMITTNSKKLWEKLKQFRAYAMVKDKKRLEEEGPWFSEQVALGYNYRLSDVACAMGISQLKKVDRFIDRRRQCAKFYDEHLNDLSNIVLPYQEDGTRSSYHLYPILVPRDRRKEIFIKMREAGIGVGVHYYPVYKHKYYQEIGYTNVCCPISEDFYAREITLPAHPKVTDEDLEYIVDKVKELLKS